MDIKKKSELYPGIDFRSVNSKLSLIASSLDVEIMELEKEKFQNVKEDIKVLLK